MENAHSPAAKPGRMKKRAEFLRAASSGRKARSAGLVLQARDRKDGAPARFGFTVTKKVGNAVVRNRTKRRLREAARKVAAEMALGSFDLVLIGLGATAKRPMPALEGDLRRALGQIMG